VLQTPNDEEDDEDGIADMKETNLNTTESFEDASC
jgi:hypothetical protein